jgi:inner membrane protein
MVFPQGMTWRFWVLSVLSSTLPDMDLFVSRLGIEFGGFWGHRGFFHSFFFAFLLSVLAAYLVSRDSTPFSAPIWKMWLFFFMLACSHGLLDALTNGGSGVAFFSPFDSTRYFFPWRPVQVSPIGWRGFFSAWGREVIWSEITWVWIPCIMLWALVKGGRYKS